MSRKIFTIGFTQKTARDFFCKLEDNHIAEIVDVRLNNTSQLSSFAKFPDIKFFLQRILNVSYSHDINLAPTTKILRDYKNKIIDWRGYEIMFAELMQRRNIDEYITDNYQNADNICLLCSEPTPEQCHRRLVAEKFAEVFNDMKIVHL